MYKSILLYIKVPNQVKKKFCQHHIIVYFTCKVSRREFSLWSYLPLAVTSSENLLKGHMAVHGQSEMWHSPGQLNLEYARGMFINTSIFMHVFSMRGLVLCIHWFIVKILRGRMTQWKHMTLRFRTVSDQCILWLTRRKIQREQGY